ncbi:MAG: UDP-N-acetylglucosamine 1-carboxyvinyltransferase [Ruminococcaceae bacterium]|nr:UDP-N-acetylglucosamine 1-carboxyvinyltransferase [Oscillospiraceae bacterium]
MEYIKINGGNTLHGNAYVQGSKNAVLPILAATILSGKTSKIHNCPKLSDVKMTVEILKFLGCDILVSGNKITVNSSNITTDFIPYEMMKKLRSSIIFLGAILSRQKSASLSFPGGCEIGLRPIDIHLKSLKMLGVDIKEEHGYLNCRLDKLKPGKIHLDFPSVGATENIMLISAISNGTTTIINAAKEPEICDLQNFLNKMGAKIKGAGTSVIVIEGVSKLNECEHTIIPDRIVASTYLSAAMITGGSVIVENVIPNHFGAVTSVFEQCGAKVETFKNSLYLKAPKKIRRVNLVRTSPYPGFPTDAQPVIVSVLSKADGVSIVKENIFENRFKHTSELIKMGADIRIEDRIAIINGVKELTGAQLFASDLRSGAALVVAALCANGQSQVYNLNFIDRGYENLVDVLKNLGADIERINDGNE